VVRAGGNGREVVAGGRVVAAVAVIAPSDQRTVASQCGAVQRARTDCHVVVAGGDVEFAKIVQSPRHLDGRNCKPTIFGPSVLHHSIDLPILDFMNEATHPERRPFQFSLRTLLLSVLVGGMTFGLIGSHLKWNREQRRALIELANFGTIQHVRLSKGSTTYTSGFKVVPKVNDGDIAYIRKLFRYLPDLESLTLEGSQISDHGLTRLAGLTRLKRLDLSSTKVSDFGLVHLQALPNLEDLDLCSSKVTEEGVAKLQRALPRCNIYRDF